MSSLGINPYTNYTWPTVTWPWWARLTLADESALPSPHPWHHHLSLPLVPWWQYIRYVVILWLFASIAPYYTPDRPMSARRVPVCTKIWKSYLWCSAPFQPIMVELQWEVNMRDGHRLYGLAWSAEMVANNCETVWTIVVVKVLVRQICFRLGIHYLMYFLGRLNVIESSTCVLCVSE